MSILHRIGYDQARLARWGLAAMLLLSLAACQSGALPVTPAAGQTVVDEALALLRELV